MISFSPTVFSPFYSPPSSRTLAFFKFFFTDQKMIFSCCYFTLGLTAFTPPAHQGAPSITRGCRFDHLRDEAWPKAGRAKTVEGTTWCWKTEHFIPISGAVISQCVRSRRPERNGPDLSLPFLMQPWLWKVPTLSFPLMSFGTALPPLSSRACGAGTGYHQGPLALSHVSCPTLPRPHVF